MRERESFGDMVKLTVNMFKEDADHNLAHMTYIIRLSKLPFQCPRGANRDSKGEGTIKSNEEGAESTRKF